MSPVSTWSIHRECGTHAASARPGRATLGRIANGEHNRYERRRVRRRCTTSAYAIATALCVAGLALGPATPLQAHVSDVDPWADTYRSLTAMFPTAAADHWRVVRYHLSTREADRLSAALGFELTPHDRRPTFYLAYDARRRFLGAAMFVTPHLATSQQHHQGAHDGHAHFELGVAVGPDGSVAAVLPGELTDTTALGSDGFVEQLRGLNVHSSFTVGDGIDPVPDYPRSSQQAVDAVREALLFMQVALGRTLPRPRTAQRER